MTKSRPADRVHTSHGYVVAWSRHVKRGEGGPPGLPVGHDGDASLDKYAFFSPVFQSREEVYDWAKKSGYLGNKDFSVLDCELRTYIDLDGHTTNALPGRQGQDIDKLVTAAECAMRSFRRLVAKYGPRGPRRRFMVLLVARQPRILVLTDAEDDWADLPSQHNGIPVCVVCTANSKRAVMVRHG